jgi:DNA-binding NarL/FixJ family response regulator
MDSVRTAFKAGGSGYVSKMEASSGLLVAIDAVIRGERFVSPSISNWDDVTDAGELDPEGDETAT